MISFKLIWREILPNNLDLKKKEKKEKIKMTHGHWNTTMLDVVSVCHHFD